MSIEVVEQKTVYEGRAFKVRRDMVRYHTQRIASVDVVEHVGAVTILPVSDGCIQFIRQYRHPIGMELLELPAGTFDPGESPEECALREIREETGFAAGRLVKLGEFYLAPGYSTEYLYIYLATELRPDPLPGDPDEFITLEPVSIEQAYEMAHDGKLADGKSLAALLLAQPYLHKP